MNDRFRFRIWEIKEKRYNKYPPYGYQGGTFNMFSTDESLVEQCTGLKDKNGKLIYEGDICRIKGTYYDCDYKEYFEIDENEEVESLEKFFGEAMLKGVYSALGCDTLQVEVIGNIHENADLLENEE